MIEPVDVKPLKDTNIKTSLEMDKDPRFNSILLITYGRSGSTLLQGVLNSLPSVLIRGENYDFCWGLYVAWKSLVSAKTKFGGPKSSSSTSAWYGSGDLNPELFMEHARKLLKEQLCPDSCSETVCWGFKEIRYIDHLDEFPAFLDFLSQLLPRPAIIFNTRDHGAVCQSAFWKRYPKKELKEKLTLADRLFFEYAERHDHAFICRYERVVLGERALRPLFDFLGASPDPEVLASVLKRPHSYDLKLDTLKDAVENRKKVTSNNVPEELNSHPCVPDKPISEYKPFGKVVVFCIVKDEMARLPWFLEYYRGLGCRDFIFIDTGSRDGTVEYLTEQTDVFLYRAPAEGLRTSRWGSEWVNDLGSMHAMHRWVLLADIDELLAWPEQDQEGLEDLANRAERLGLNRIFNPMIDIYPEEPCDALPDYEPGKPFSEYAHLMDDVVYIKAKWVSSKLLLYSGPRLRYHTNPSKPPPVLVKQNFYYVEQEGFKHIGSHFDTYTLPSPMVVPFLHFKFLPDFNRRIQTSISEGIHWNNALEYRDYASAQLSARSLIFKGSVDFRSDEGLKKYIQIVSRFLRKSGLCGSVHWKKHATEEDGTFKCSPLRDQTAAR